MFGRTAMPYGAAYRYGFNGKENGDDIKGIGLQQDYGMRIYDPRIGRFLSVDPLTSKFPHLTPYQYASNTPIQAIDLDGLESRNVNTGEVDNSINPKTASTYQKNSDARPWKDLIKFKPSSSVLKSTDERIAAFALQKIEDVVSKKVNLDYYAVTIDKLPRGFENAEAFFSYFRKNLNSFLEGGGAEFESYNSKEGKIWDSDNATSSVMSFQINMPVYDVDEASVMTGQSATNSWVFSTVFTFHDLGHPVSGNRQFGITTNPNGTHTLFIRGADRIHSAADITFGGTRIFQGAHRLWSKTMLNVATYIIVNGGAAMVNPHVSKRIDWDESLLKNNRKIDEEYFIQPTNHGNCHCSIRNFSCFYIRTTRKRRRTGRSGLHLCDFPWWRPNVSSIFGVCDSMSLFRKKINRRRRCFHETQRIGLCSYLYRWYAFNRFNNDNW